MTTVLYKRRCSHHAKVLDFASGNIAIMASEKLFTDIPPFPDNVPTVPMYTISLASLHSGRENAAERLLAACQELGFFLLDLRGDELGDTVTEEIDRLFGLGRDIMSLPEDVKRQYLHDIPRSFLG